MELSIVTPVVLAYELISKDGSVARMSAGENETATGLRCVSRSRINARTPPFEVREGGRNELKILFNDDREVTLCQDWNKVFWRKRRPISNIKIKGLTPSER